MKNNKFDELAKGMAQSVTRRQALKKFSIGLAGMALACFGLANVAKAGKGSCLKSNAKCDANSGPCCSGLECCIHPGLVRGHCVPVGTCYFGV